MKAFKISTPLLIATVALIYMGAYLAHPALPGNNLEYPLGWWGWFDQSQYLRAAKAYSAGDLSPGNFFYPPLYPFLGTLFLKWLPNHPFFFVDGFAFVWFSYVFIRFAQRYVSDIEALALFVVTVVLNYEILENFIIPWTTAGTVAVYSYGIYALLRLSETRESPLAIGRAVFHACVFSLLLGSLVLLRPVDAAGSAFMFLGYLYLDWRSRGSTPILRDWSNVLLVGVTLTVGVLCCFVLLLAYNLKVYGSAFGGYFQSAANASGYFLWELPRRAFSLIFDSWSVYLEPRASLTGHVPWTLVGLFGVALALCLGDTLLVVVASSVVLGFTLYAPYGDLQPNGVWRYLNIHYFKWMFPYLGLFAWLSVRWLVGRSVLPKRVIWPLRYVVTTLFFLFAVSLRFTVVRDAVHADVRNTMSGRQIVRIALSNAASQNGLDFIDLPGIKGGFNEVYFGEPQAELDGRKLKWVRDFRLIPAPWGVRMFFNAPIKGHDLTLYPNAGLIIPAKGFTASEGRYWFSLGHPCFPRDRERCISPDSKLSLLGPGEDVEHSSTNIIFSGWSADEAAFRWSEEKEARISFLIDTTSSHYFGRLEIAANSLGSQAVNISLNNTSIYSGTWQASMPVVDISFSPDLLRNGVNVLTFSLPDAHQPGNGDPRILALALRHFNIR